MAMNMKQLEYVITIAECGSFNKAAEELGISQPSLSQYIKKIEKQIGQQLFNRSGTNIRLTDAGEIYIENGKKILAIERKMENEFTDLASNKKGTIIIGASPFRAASMLPKAAGKFKQLYPGIQLVIKEGTTEELINATFRGDFDICVITMPVNEEFLEIDAVVSEEMVIAVPEDFDIGNTKIVPGRKHPAADAKNLDGLPFVMLSENQIMQRALNFMCEQEGIRVNKAAVCYSIETQINMVGAGIGLALVPAGIESIAPSNIRLYSVAGELPQRKCAVVHKKGQMVSRVCADLAKIIAGEES